MTLDLTAGIVRVLDSDGQTAGTGFVVNDDGLIATCSHVVQDEESQRRGIRRPDYADVVFHATGDCRRARVESQWWRPADAEDVAILRLEGTLPESVAPVLLGSSAGVEGHTLTTFGFPAAKPVDGMPAQCEAVGRTTERGFPVLQLRSSEVTSGFSGAPTLDAATHHLVGMITSVTTLDQYGRQSETVFVTPVETLQAICPLLLAGTPEARYRDFLRMAYGFWERRFTSLEMTAEEPKQLSETRRSWIPPCFSALKELAVITAEEGERPTMSRIPLPGGLPQALDEYQAVILLGAPGSGKTTALAHFAGQVAYNLERIPVLVPLRRYERDEEPLSFLRRTWALALQDHLRGAIEAREAEPVSLHRVDRAIAPLTTQIEHLMARGRLTLLLDGLNEIPGLIQDDVRLSRLAAFLESARAQGNRVVVACRVMDYAGLRRPLERPLQQITLEPLDDQRIQAFLHSYVGDEEGNTLFNWLRQPEGRSILELCRVPFFLGLVAYLHEQEGAPPARRVELLDRYIHVAVKREQKRVRQDWPPVLLVEPLSELALAMQERQKLEIWEDEARRHLCYFHEGGASAALRLAEGAGLLRLALTRDPRGARVRFVHQLWQQHLAARALVKRCDRRGVLLFETLQRHLVEDQWREVLVLSAAMLEDGTTLIERLLAANAQDDSQQRPLFVAANAVAEGAVTDEPSLQEIVDGLERLIRERYLWESSRADASDALAAMGRLDVKCAAKRILALVCDTGLDLRKRLRAAETLDRANQAIEAAKAWLSLACNRELDLETRWRAAEILKELGQADEAAQAWLSIIGDRGVRAGMRLQAAGRASRCGRGERAIQAWAIITHDKELDIESRLQAAEFLARLGRPLDLACLACGPQGTFHRCSQAIDMLAALEHRDSLLSLSKDSMLAVELRERAVKALSELGQIEEAVAVLVSLASDETVAAEVRVKALETLMTLDQPQETTQAWAALARDKTAEARWRERAAEALSELGQIEEAVAVLVSLASDETVAAEVRVKALETLMTLDRPRETTQVLVAMAHDEALGMQWRQRAAEALSELGQFDEAVGVLVSQACDATVASKVRLQALEVLGALDRPRETIRALVTTAHDETSEMQSRERAAEALMRLGPMEEAVTVLLSLGRDEAVATEAQVCTIGSVAELGQVEAAVATVILLSLAPHISLGKQVRLRCAEALQYLGRSRLKMVLELGPLTALQANPYASKIGKAARIALYAAIESFAEQKDTASLLTLAREGEISAGVRRTAAWYLGRLGQADEAADVLLALARSTDADLQERRLAADRLGRLGGWGNTAADALLALAQDTSLPLGFRRQTAESLAQLGRVGEAAGILLALARDTSVQRDFRRTTAELLAQLGYVDEAARTLVALVRDTRARSGERWRAAESLDQLGRLNEVARSLLRLAQVATVQPRERSRAAKVLGNLAKTLDDSGRLDEAIEALRRSLEIDEKSGIRKHIRGTRSRLGKALYIKSQIEDKDLTVKDHHQLGRYLLCEKRDYESASHHLTAALDLGCETAQRGRLHSQIGYAAFKLADYERAASHFRRAIEMGEDNAIVNAILARALHNLHELPESIRQHFEWSLRLDDENGVSHNWFSTFLRETGDLTGAEIHARRAVELQPQNPRFLEDVALILTEYGDREHMLEAETYFRKAMERASPDSPWGQRHSQGERDLLSQMESQEVEPEQHEACG